MPGVYSRNKTCDVEFWIGEQAMDDFEEFVFVDEIMETSTNENYETAIDNFWPLFIADLSV